jgi:hypothetical protein
MIPIFNKHSWDVEWPPITSSSVRLSELFYPDTYGYYTAWLNLEKLKINREERERLRDLMISKDLESRDLAVAIIEKYVSDTE